jgi:hypothetical protein
VFPTPSVHRRLARLAGSAAGSTSEAQSARFHAGTGVGTAGGGDRRERRRRCPGRIHARGL